MSALLTAFGLGMLVSSLLDRWDRKRQQAHEHSLEDHRPDSHP